MKKTKVVVFDFDNTLYFGIDWTKEWAEFCKNGLKFVFRDWNDKDFNKMVKNENLTNFTSNDIIRVIKKYKKDVNDWITFRTINNCDLDLSNVVSINSEVLEEFSKKYVLYIVSNATMKDINFISFHLDIDLSKFKEIIINNYSHGSDKEYYYKQIIEKEQIKPSELFVIGDSEETDIFPAQKIGARGKKVDDCNFHLEDFDL